MRMRCVNLATGVEPASPFTANPGLSGTTLAVPNPRIWQKTEGPVIVDTANARAFLVDTSASLRAYDLGTGLPLFSPVQLTTAPGHHRILPAFVEAADLLLAIDPVAVSTSPEQYHIYAFDASTGVPTSWSPLVVSKSPILAAVLEQGVALLNLGGTEIRPLYSNGFLGDAVRDVAGQVVAGIVRVVVDGHYLVENGAELIAYRSDCSPINTCSAKVNSLGCTPAISALGSASISGLDGFHIRASQVPGQTAGTLLWSLSANPSTTGSGVGTTIGSAWGAKGCLVRAQSTGATTSGGTAGVCDGVLDFHFSQSFMAAHGLTAGAIVYAQFVYSDPNHPDGSGLGLSDALKFRICP